jgi:hypothetical protein
LSPTAPSPAITRATAAASGDANHDNQITVDEILTAVNNALNGCVQSP